jgi:superfamily II DNA or RNA helicase
MARTPTLTYDRGTLLLHPPPKGKAWLDFATWDERVERFRIPAIKYRALVETMLDGKIEFTDEAKGFDTLELPSAFSRSPYVHQLEALDKWKRSGRRGVVVLPTASGKTYLAQMAMEATPRSTLICVPTLDLMHQWYAHLKTAFPEAQIGLLGGGSRDLTCILIATYNSAAIHAETLGNKFGLLIFDECHHLPGGFFRTTAEYSIAPYRLGLSATVERADGSHSDLDDLIGGVVYHKTPDELRSIALADYRVEQIMVSLLPEEQSRYKELIGVRNMFLRDAGIDLRQPDGWQTFVQMSARSRDGRRAMLSHREAKRLATGTESKLRVLVNLLAAHPTEQKLIFTDDNATVYRISQDFLIPALTHQTPVKERHRTLGLFRDGTYRILVASHVLNEGVDVPEASVAILLSGSGSSREFIQRLGRILRKSSTPVNKRCSTRSSPKTRRKSAPRNAASKRRRHPHRNPVRFPNSPGATSMTTIWKRRSNSLVFQVSSVLAFIEVLIDLT